jgi:YVTN family beta-propeller protein
LSPKLQCRAVCYNCHVDRPSKSGSETPAWRRWARRVLFVVAGFVTIAVLAVVGLNVYPLVRPPAKTVRSLRTISLRTGFPINLAFVDYMAIDGQMLYAGFTSHSAVRVIDEGTNRVIASIDGLPGVHGVALVPDRNLAFTSNGEDNTVGVFALSDHKLVKKLPAGGGPDAITYDEKLKLVYVANGEGKTGTLIDPQTEEVVATIPLGGRPEFCVADPETGLIYQNLNDTSELAVIDPQKRSVTRRYKLTPGQGPTGLAFDAVHRRLFSTASNKKLIVINADNGEIVADLPIGRLVDGVAYDPVLRRVYTANGLGTMTVIQQDGADIYHVLEDAPTRFGGHSLVVDPVTHRIYVASWGTVAVYEPLPQ